MNFTPVLLDVPEKFDSERLEMRAVAPGNGAVHFPAVQESIADLRRYLAHLPWIKEEPSLANSEKYCRIQRSSFIQRDNLVFFIFLKSDQSFVGSIGLHRIDWSVPKFEIGYWCRTSAQGNGYMVEAVQAITQMAMARLAAHRIEIRADDVNVLSWKVAEKAGFELEGILRKSVKDEQSGELRDLRVYAKIA